jgi:hypothetical protein
MSIEAVACPKCPAWMIRYPTGVMLTSNPPQVEMVWWCACGYSEASAPARQSLIADQRFEWWQAVNRQRIREEQQAAARRGGTLLSRVLDRLRG